MHWCWSHCFSEHNVEVMFNIKHQNALITAAHEGLGNTVTSKSLSGHFSRGQNVCTYTTKVRTHTQTCFLHCMQIFFQCKHKCCKKKWVSKLIINLCVFLFVDIYFQMHIKYCEPCQMHQVNKLDKFPHELQPIKILNKNLVSNQ